MTNEALLNENEELKKRLANVQFILNEVSEQRRMEREEAKKERDRLCLEIKELREGAVSY